MKIAIISGFGKSQSQRDANVVPFDYVEKIPEDYQVYILPLNVKNKTKLIEDFDLFIFPGGADINPSFYNETAHESTSSEDLFDEYITLADELAMELEEIMPEDAVMNARAYKWDNTDDAIKVVIAIGHAEQGELKVFDVARRLLSQVD